jgi:hypothetical protein
MFLNYPPFVGFVTGEVRGALLTAWVHKGNEQFFTESSDGILPGDPDMKIPVSASSHGSIVSSHLVIDGPPVEY